PFVLLTESPGSATKRSSTLHWSIRLFGPAIRYWPYSIHVFQCAGDTGIGQQRTQYQLASVVDANSGATLWTPESDSGSQPAEQNLDTDKYSPPSSRLLRWRFETPTKVSRRGSAILSELSGLDLVLAGRRRHEIMTTFYGDSAVNL